MEPPCRGEWLSHRIQRLDLVLALDDTDNRRRKRKAEATENAFCDGGSQKEATSDGVDTRRQFHASDCISLLAKRLGVKSEAESCLATLVPNFAVDRRRLEVTKKSLKREMDKSWARLALEDGVRCAKGGSYDEAIVAYEQAIKLDPSNADARVARGAARANKGSYEEAMMDFEAALDMQPGHKNAIEYRDRVAKRKRENENRKLVETTVRRQSDRLSYGHGLFGRGLPLKSTEKARPTEQDVQLAMDVLKSDKNRSRRKRKHKRHRRP